jgi:hypothetical protein
MFLIFWLVLCLAAAALLLLPLALWRREIYKQYSGSRPVACPENQQPAAVSIDVAHAAATGIDGCPGLRLAECTRWPERSDCNQACLAQAVRAESYPPGKVKGRKKQIYHLPILLAASAAWYLGLIWHSHYMFRARWMDAVGLNRAQVHQLLGWYWLHLFPVAVCLLFAYGVAGLLAVRHRKGALQGVLMSVLLCLALVATTWLGIARLPRELMMIEAGYIALATIIVGVIVGGLYDKLVMPSP